MLSFFYLQVFLWIDQDDCLNLEPVQAEHLEELACTETTAGRVFAYLHIVRFLIFLLVISK